MDIREYFERSPFAERVLSGTIKSDAYNVYVKHPLGHLKLRAPHGDNFRNSAYFTYEMMINGNSWAEHKVHTRAIHDNGLESSHITRC